MSRPNPFATADFVPGLHQPESDEPYYWFIFDGQRMLVTGADSAGVRQTPCGRSLADLGLPAATIHFLGQLGETGCVTAMLPGVEAPAGMSWQHLRRLYGSLPESHFAVAGRAVQIANWAQNHQFCGRCGTPTEANEKERSLVCPQCKLHFYPRLSPAVIVLVERDGHVLLAHSPRHPPGLYSVLAGFVEPGETLEETIAREIFEEVGLSVRNIRYFGSQPWPFPDSLMLAFTCEYAGGDIHTDQEEISHADWFTPTTLPQIPPPLSIARQLIDWFVARNS